MAINEKKIIEIALKHLNLVLEYNPYANFDKVSTRSDFIKVIKNDPAFANVGFACDKYVIARIGGNLITSLHRKLGDMYEEIFQYLLKETYLIDDTDFHYSVEVKIGDRKQTRSTDGLLRSNKFKEISIPSLKSDWRNSKGIAFELRSCYQIGDSKRIQADWDMALALKAQNIIPVMLITCATSLKSPITRLKRSWNLYEGVDTFQFIKELMKFDLLKFMEQNRNIISAPVKKIMANL